MSDGVTTSDAIAAVAWPNSEGIWMGNIKGVGWFPLKTMALKDDLPSSEQLRLEAESPATAPPRATLAIVAQWPENAESWPFTFQGCHPVKEWRQPTEDELKKAKHFYQLS